MIRFNPAANAVDTRTPEWPTELARLAERSSQPGLQALRGIMLALAE